MNSFGISVMSDKGLGIDCKDIVKHLEDAIAKMNELADKREMEIAEGTRERSTSLAGVRK